MKGVVTMKKMFYCIGDCETGECYWPADSFNENELKVIKRFLNELNEHASKANLNELTHIVIMDEEDFY